jgi:hypothetical protein
MRRFWRITESVATANRSWTGYSSLVEVTHRRSPLYIAVLAVAAGSILIVGWLVRPREIAQSPPPVPSETELQELARRAQRRSLESTTAYFAHLATDVRGSVAYIPSLATSGVIWNESHIVAGPIPIAAERRTIAVRTASGERPAEAILSRRLPLSLLNIGSGASASVPHRAATSPHTGDWIVAVWQTDETPAFAAATFSQMATTTCGVAHVRELVSSASLGPPMIGGAVFNMNRELVGMILPCGDRVALIEPSGVDEMLKRAMTVEEGVVANFGVLFSALMEDDRQYFRDADGLLAREVWNGTPAEAVGVRPGDLVTALNGQAVTTIDDLRPLMMRPEAAFELRVRRGSKTETLKWVSSAVARASGGNATTFGLVFEPAPRIASNHSCLEAAPRGLD